MYLSQINESLTIDNFPAIHTIDLQNFKHLYPEYQYFINVSLGRSLRRTSRPGTPKFRNMSQQRKKKIRTTPKYKLKNYIEPNRCEDKNSFALCTGPSTYLSEEYGNYHTPEDPINKVIDHCQTFVSGGRCKTNYNYLCNSIIEYIDKSIEQVDIRQDLIFVVKLPVALLLYILGHKHFLHHAYVDYSYEEMVVHLYCQCKVFLNPGLKRINWALKKELFPYQITPYNAIVNLWRCGKMYQINSFTKSFVAPKVIWITNKLTRVVIENKWKIAMWVFMAMFDVTSADILTSGISMNEQLLKMRAYVAIDNSRALALVQSNEVGSYITRTGFAAVAYSLFESDLIKSAVQKVRNLYGEHQRMTPDLMEEANERLFNELITTDVLFGKQDAIKELSNIQSEEFKNTFIDSLISRSVQFIPVIMMMYKMVPNLFELDKKFLKIIQSYAYKQLIKINGIKKLLEMRKIYGFEKLFEVVHTFKTTFNTGNIDLGLNHHEILIQKYAKSTPEEQAALFGSVQSLFESFKSCKRKQECESIKLANMVLPDHDFLKFTPQENTCKFFRTQIVPEKLFNLGSLHLVYRTVLAYCTSFYGIVAIISVMILFCYRKPIMKKIYDMNPFQPQQTITEITPKENITIVHDITNKIIKINDKSLNYEFIPRDVEYNITLQIDVDGNHEDQLIKFLDEKLFIDNKELPYDDHDHDNEISFVFENKSLISISYGIGDPMDIDGQKEPQPKIVYTLEPESYIVNLISENVPKKLIDLIASMKIDELRKYDKNRGNKYRIFVDDHFLSDKELTDDDKIIILQTRGNNEFSVFGINKEIDEPKVIFRKYAFPIL